MSRLYGYVTEDMSMFTIELGSNDKVLSLNITGDTSDGLDHSIYYLIVYWGDGTFTPGTVGKINLLDTHTYPDYGTYDIQIFLVSAYQNSYAYSFSRTLTKGEPIPEEPHSSSSESSSPKEYSSGSDAPTPVPPPAPSIPKESSGEGSHPTPDPQDSSSQVVPPSPQPPFVPLPSETKESSSEFSKGNMKEDSSNSGKSINIGWVALIFVACMVVLIGGMFLFLKITSRKRDGTAYNELELDN